MHVGYETRSFVFLDSLAKDVDEINVCGTLNLRASSHLHEVKIVSQGRYTNNERVAKRVYIVTVSDLDKISIIVLYLVYRGNMEKLTCEKKKLTWI